MQNRTPSQTRSKPSVEGDRHEDRRGQQQDADPVDEAAEDDPDGHHDQDHAHRPDRQVGHRLLDQLGAAGQGVDADQRRRAEEEPVQHRRDLGRVDHGAVHAGPAELAVPGRGDHRTGDADTRRLGRRGPAHVERAEDAEGDQAGQDQFLQQRELLAQRHRQVFGRGGRRQLRLQLAAHDDVERCTCRRASARASRRPCRAGRSRRRR